MRVVVIGSTGQVAECLKSELPGAVYLTRADLDLARPAQIAPVLSELNPEFVINAAAYTAVDLAETEYEQALAVNGEAVGRLAEFCASSNLPLIHISTDYVFPGDGQRPYLETDQTDPINAYGRSKLAGERAISAAALKNAWILRTSWVFSEHGNNFVKTMLRLGAERDSLNIVHDQIGRPTYARDIAEIIRGLAELYELGQPVESGLYHCASAGVTSWYEFAAEIFNQAFAADVLSRLPGLKPITTAEFPTPARRPGYSVLDTSKLDAALSPSADWRVGVGKVLHNLH